MKRLTAALVWVTLAQMAQGQMLLNEVGRALEPPFQFDPTFIARNGMMSFEISYQTKKSNRPIRELNDRSKYAFDAEGRLQSYIRIQSAGGITDTTEWHYTRNHRGQVIRKLERDSRGFFIVETKYTAVGDRMRTNIYKSASRLEIHAAFRPADHTYISSETYESTMSENWVQETAHNNYGLPYEQTRWELNALGYVTEEQVMNLVTRRSTTRTFSYTEQGRMAAVHVTESHRPETERIYAYVYDRAGNLVSMTFTDRGELQESWEVVYDEHGRIDGIIISFTETEAIRILNFHYSKP